MIPQEQDHGNVPVFLSGILKINPRSKIEDKSKIEPMGTRSGFWKGWRGDIQGVAIGEIHLVPISQGKRGVSSSENHGCTQAAGGGKRQQEKCTYNLNILAAARAPKRIAELSADSSVGDISSIPKPQPQGFVSCRACKGPHLSKPSLNTKLDGFVWLYTHWWHGPENANAL